MIKKSITVFLLMVLTATVISPVPLQAKSSRDDFVPSTDLLASESQIRTYQVRSGDTVWEIAQKANVDVYTILAINDLKENSIIQEGQYLDIPYSRQKLHRVRSGDSLWKIAGMYQVSVEQLVKLNNNLKNPDQLKIGQTINIPAQSNMRNAVAREFPSRGTLRKYLWPVIGTISSKYGWRKSGFHHGLDIACPINTPIKAVASGKVVKVAVQPVFGRLVLLEHSDGTRTLYAHARKILVHKGQRVKKGQVIARVGMSGRTTGPHLHFQVFRAGKTVNPLAVLK